MTGFGSIARRALLSVAVVCSAACFDSGMRAPPRMTTADPIAVDPGQTFQHIDGFGASSAWTASNMSDARADELFSPTAGIGLSLLRLRIAPDGTTGELATAQKAVARGARVWAAPWSPPAEWKDSTSANDGGGSLLPADAQPWADWLAAFAKSMSAEGVPLIALSAQNEPNYGPTSYESCLYSASQLVAFVRDNLGPALARQGISTPIMAPESANWTSFDGFATAFVSDSAAMRFVGPLATHAYAGTPHTVAGVPAGTAVWETEVSDPNKTPDLGIGSALRVAKMIHDNLVIGQVNAWHWWWINPSANPAPDNASLTSSNVLTKRAYALGNWARFVRPGFVRVSATPAPQSSVSASAFADPASGRVVIVVVNQSGAALPQTFTLAGGPFDQVIPWLTSAASSLQAQGAVPVTDGSFSVTLEASSVTSFVADPAVVQPDASATD